MSERDCWAVAPGAPSSGLSGLSGKGCWDHPVTSSVGAENGLGARMPRRPGSSLRLSAAVPRRGLGGFRAGGGTVRGARRRLKGREGARGGSGKGA